MPYVEGGGQIGTREGDPLSLAQYWRMVSRRKGVLLAFTLAGTLTAFLLTRTQIPMYRARALIEIESLNEDFLNTKNVNPTSDRLQSPEYNVQTQTMVLQSRPVIERAINKMDIEQRLIDSSRPAPAIFHWLEEQPVAVQAVVSPRERALSMVEAGLKVRAQPNTRLIEVTFDSRDPRLGADVVNAITEGFAEQNRDARRETSRKTSKWLNDQVADVKAKLEKGEDTLQKYASDSSLTFLSEKDNVAGERLRQLQLDLLKAQSDRVAKQSAYELATAAPAESLPEVLDDPTLKDYQVQLTALRRQLAELSSTFAPENPKVVNVQAQIATVEAALQSKRSDILSRIRNDYESASRRESLLEAAYNSQTELLSNQSTKIAHYSVLQREVDTARQLYDSMMQRVKEAGLASAMQVSEIQVVESARPPRLPFKPDLLVNTIFGLFSGICLGVIFIIHSARSARGFQAPGEIAVHLNVPELGMIPSTMEPSRVMPRLLGKSSAEPPSAEEPTKLELTAKPQWHSAISEFRLTLDAIRRLPGRSSLRTLPVRDPAAPELTTWKGWRATLAKSLHLTLESILQATKIGRLAGWSGSRASSDDGPAKLELSTWQQWHSPIAESFRLTLTSLLLSSGKNGEQPRAIVISSALPGEGKTTVISNLGIALAQVNWRVLLIDGDLRKPRLHEVFDLGNGAGFSDVLAGEATMPIYATKIPNLSVLPGGKGMDERLFFTSPFRDVLRSLKAEFDMILIDSPPLLRMADARLLSHHADAVILVVAQPTSREAVLLATQHLADDGSRLLGTILNNWKPKTDNPGYGTYGDYENRYQRT